ncbi:MAG: hypothetical protein J6R29_03270, partial [Clostridia bacterium]|nr:hypothetical protein [Clostridia bacterium]
RESEDGIETKQSSSPYQIKGSIASLIVILITFAIVNNFVKDGFTTWAPSILKESFNLSSSFSIFLTILLPLSATFGAVFNTLLNKKIKSFISQGAFWYLCSALMMTVIMLFIGTNIWLIVLIAISLNALFMASINNLVTAIAPLYLRDKINTGFLAGIIDGCCYVGSALSSIGFALVKEISGTWSNLFIILTVICLIPVIVSTVYTLCNKLKSK